MPYRFSLFFLAFFFAVSGVFFVAPSAHAAFSLAAIPSSGQIDQGGNINFVVTATLISGTEGPVGFTILNLPDGATPTFSTGSCTPTCSTLITVSTGSAAPVTNQVITIQAIGGTTESVNYTLTITDPLASIYINKTITQTDDTVTQSGFNLIGNTKTNALVSGTGDSASVGLSVSGSAVIDIKAAGKRSLALKSDGTVLAWGGNVYGGLGDGSATTRYTPVQVSGLGAGSGVIAIAAAEDHSLALKSDGTVLAWGGNVNGQVGDGSTTTRYTPVQVSGLGAGSGVIAIAAGGSVYTGSSMALKSDGTVLVWGNNGNGKLGDGTTTNRNTPVQVSGLGAGSGVTAIAMGTKHALALKSDGTLLAWGYNAYGAIGDGTTTDRWTPTAVSGLGAGSGVTAIAAGGSNYSTSYVNYSLALKSDGTVLGWGVNSGYQLGDGTTTTRTTPVQTSGLGAGSGVTAIAAGYHHSLALFSSGQVKAWGTNVDGQLGDGTTTTRTTPVQVSGFGAGSGATAIAAAGERYSKHSLALKSDGTVFGWGATRYGNIGNNPVLTVGGCSDGGGGFYDCYLSVSTPVQTHGVSDVGYLILNVYNTSGTFTSGPIDLSSSVGFSSLAWTSAIPSSATSITLDARSGTANPDCASAIWNAWQTGVATITTANTASSAPITVANGQCFQYRANLATTNTAQTPALQDMTVMYQVPYNFNFSLATNPTGGKTMQGGSDTATPGASATLTMGTAPNNVTFTKVASTLPIGMDVIFGTPSCAITCTSTFTITTTGATPLGIYAIPIRASVIIDAQNTITKEVTYTLSVEQPFDFSMTWSGTSSGAVVQGASVLTSFNATQTAGATSESTLFSYGTTAPGVSVAFSFNSCFPTCGVTAEIRTTFTGGAGDTPIGGPHTVTITGTSATGVVRSLTFTLTINPGFNFSMALDNTSGGTFAGGSPTSQPTLTTTYVSGASGSVSYNITNPDAVNITITPATIANCTLTTLGQTCTQALSISTLPPIAPTTYSIIIKGTSTDGLARYATYVLTVYPPFDFDMQYVPATGNFNAAATPQDSDIAIILQGEAVYPILNITYNSPLPQTVSFATGIAPSASGNITITIPPSCTSTCSIPLVITSNDQVDGDFTITITGTGGAKTHTVTYNLTVNIPPFDYNMYGWAWSDAIGWISFNSRNCDIDWDEVMDRVNVGKGTGDASAPAQCPPDGTYMPNYGAHLDFSTYELSGYAWSENVGWITFEKSIAGTPPQAPFNNGSQNYIATLTDGIMEGWARAVSCMNTACDTDSEWGWIKMSGVALEGSPYEVRTISASDLSGYAWGSDVLGWISFNSLNCDKNGDGTYDGTANECYIPPGALYMGSPELHSAGSPVYPYKVWALGTLPNAAPVASNPQSNFLDRCALPFSPTLSFLYKDNEGDPLVQYTINIYDGTDTLVDGPIVVNTDPTLYDPNPLQEIPVTYAYTGALNYNGTYYFTVEVRDEAHLN